MPLTLLLLCAGAGVLPAWWLARLQSPLGRHAPALLPMLWFAVCGGHWPAVARGAVVSDSWQWVPSLGVSLGLRLDGFSLLFALLITGIGALVTVYATAYLAERPVRERARFIALIQAFMVAMLGAVLADDLVALLVFWEATSVLSFLLIGFDSQRAEARRAAWQSLMVTAVGGVALLAAVVLIGMELQTLSLSALAQGPVGAPHWGESEWLVPIALLILLAAWTKSAQFPFHFWLPQAMAAPTPASAYLHSATMVKLGVYLLARFDAVFAPLAWFGPLLVLVGSLTIAVAALGALRASQYKALLAQSTVASLGLLVMLIGLDGPQAALALCAFIVAHAGYKAALFCCAGTAIHAAQCGDMNRLGGLARPLPWTAAAAVLAALSMAGVAPWWGFVAKEAVFEAQWASRWVGGTVAVSAIAAALFVAIALRVLRPFFVAGVRQGVPSAPGGSGSHAAVAASVHRETPGLVLGPALLGGLGLVLGLQPGWLGQALIGPAAEALQGGPVSVSWALWHGVSPALLLSVAALVLGGALAYLWPRLQRVVGPQRCDADRIYQAVVDGVLAGARTCTRQLQSGDSRRYVGLIVVTLLACGAWSLIQWGGTQPWWRVDAALPWRLVPALLLAFGLLGALVAARSAVLLTGLLGVGVIGYGSALLFLLHGAPDLALTQFAVETLVLVALMAVLVRLPAQAAPTRSSGERRRDAVLAGAVGVLVFVALASMLAQPFDDRLSAFFGATSLVQAHGRNVVNVIIVDYRALDTLGEISVVGFATLGVWVLLRRNGRRQGAAGGVALRPSLIASATARWLVGAMLVASWVILWRGHNQPGGGFVGGLVAALALALVALFDGVARARRLLRIHPVALAGLGVLLAVLSGLPGLWRGEGFLSHQWWNGPAGLQLGTTLLFDIGVYCTVLGGMLCLVLRLYAGAAAPLTAATEEERA